MLSQIKNLYHFVLAWLGDVWYGHPSRHLYVIGVTGTKGKSTTVELLSSVLEAAGKKTAFLSSVHFKVAGTYQKNVTGNTMPGRLTIQRWLRQAVGAGCEYAILEVTSQGVVQHRHRFIDFDVVALTCLHPEHVESHGSFEAYRDAKASLFRDVARASQKKDKLFFINTGTGENAKYFEEAALHPTGKGTFGSVIFYGKEDFVTNALGGDVRQVGEWLSSQFNLENAAAVYAIASRQGIDKQNIIDSLRCFKGVVGRQEYISGYSRTVVIDSALTPESLEAIYIFLRQKLESVGKGGRLIGVFGSAGGGRDIWKRPALGRIAAAYCNHVFLTTDDAYDESPEKIIADIAKGFQDAKKYTAIIDRQAAIQAAITQAGPDDIVALTGMGSQSYTYGCNGTKKPWDERAVAEAVLRQLDGR